MSPVHFVPKHSSRLFLCLCVEIIHRHGSHVNVRVYSLVTIHRWQTVLGDTYCSFLCTSFNQQHLNLVIQLSESKATCMCMFFKVVTKATDDVPFTESMPVMLCESWHYHSSASRGDQNFTSIPTDLICGGILRGFSGWFKTQTDFCFALLEFHIGMHGAMHTIRGTWRQRICWMPAGFFQPGKSVCFLV